MKKTWKPTGVTGENSLIRDDALMAINTAKKMLIITALRGWLKGDP
ncbi:hypothetical protein [Scytonema sp. UIC 10036]|nr:hypothetical protein [Scytonema sp. UIC 10036]